MKHRELYYQVIASLLVIALFVGNLTACKSQVATETTVANGDVDITINVDGSIAETEDSDWYHCSTYSIETEYEDDHYNQIINTVISATDSTITTLVCGFLINYEGITFGNDGFHREFLHLVKYDFTTGEQDFFVDLSDYCKYVEDENGQQEYSFIKALETENCYYLLYKYSNYSSGVYEYHVLEIDNQTGDILSDTVPVNLNDKLESNVQFFGSAIDGTRIVMLTGNWSSEPPYISSGRIISYDVSTDEASSCPLGVTLTANDAYSIRGISKIDENYYGITAYSMSDAPLCLLYDIRTNETELLDMNEAMSDITDYIYGLSFGNLCNTYSNVLTIQGEDYVATLDTESMKFVKTFDMNHCNINNYEFDLAGSVESNEEYTVLVDGLYSYGEGILGVLMIEHLDENPYAGRQLITAAALGRGVTYEESEIIYRFNETSEDYYIAIDTTYSYDNDDEYNIDNLTYLTDNAQITAQLAVDLMAGNGPDIIFDGFEFAELNNSNSLINLTPYLENTVIFDDTQYATNAFELAKNEDGELYQIPINAMISGIGYPIDSVENYTTVGFTFEEYTEFVSNERNGWDPISMETSQIDYFVTCFNAMRDEFIVSGEIDLDNDAFYELATYINDNVNSGYTVTEYYDLSGESSSGYMYDYNQYVVGSLYYSYVNGDLISYRGLPSNDARGPQLNISNSIGVSSSCSNIDGAVGFILFALSEESQMLYANNQYNSLNYNAMSDGLYRLRDAIEAESDIMQLEDESFWSYYHYYTDDEVDAAVDLYFAMIDTASGFVGGDSDISIILYEEMPAYFCGDKSLEDVIDIIESRVQTVLDERG